MKSSLRAILSLFCMALAQTLVAQKTELSPFDTTAYSVKTEAIKGKKYIGFLNQSGFYLLDDKSRIVVFQPGEYFTWELRDFDGDGNKDIFISTGGNTPEVYDLLIYISADHYRQIHEFALFPAPTKINGTKYFYSYHKSGCADMDWDSDLFYIQNFKAVRIGNISGRECKNSGTKDGVYINKVHRGKKSVLKILAVDTLTRFKEYKWGFIKRYWTKYYTTFL